MKRFKLQIIILILSSIILTFITVKLSYNISKVYYKNYPYFMDAAGFMSANINLLHKYEPDKSTNSQIYKRIKLAINEFQINPVYPLRTIPLILFAPSLLGNQWGHLFTTVPMFFIFILVLGYSIYIRTNNILYSVSITTLFCSAPLFLHPVYGLSAFWLDLSASFLLGAAILSFINWFQWKNNFWLISFAIFSSLAILSRYNFAVYVFLLFFPVYCYSAYKDWKQTKNTYLSIIKPTLIISGIFLLLCGYFLIKNFSYFYYYYNNFGYDVSTPAKSAKSFLNTYIQFFPWKYMLILFFIFLLGFMKSNIKNQIDKLIIYFWFLLVLPMFLIFIVNAYTTRHAFFVFFPLLFLILSTSIFYEFKKIKKLWFIIISCFLILVSINLLYKTYNLQINTALNPTKDEKELKEVDVEIADFIKTLNKEVKWEAFFKVLSFKVNCESYYRNKVFTVYTEKLLFSNEKVYWTGVYPQFNPQQLADFIYSKIDNLDFIITLENPQIADSSKRYNNNEYTRLVTKNIAEKIKTNTNWEKKKIYKSKIYSDLAFYIKKD